MNQYFVYILKCFDDSYYVGVTNQLERRLIEHQEGLNAKCFTFKRRPLELQFKAEFDNVLRAIHFEKQLKGWSRSKKEAMINGDYDLLQILSECRNATHYKYNVLSKKQSPNQWNTFVLDHGDLIFLFFILRKKISETNISEPIEVLEYQIFRLCLALKSFHLLRHLLNSKTSSQIKSP